MRKVRQDDENAVYSKTEKTLDQMPGQENTGPEFVGPNIRAGKYRTGMCMTKCHCRKTQDRKMKDHGHERITLAMLLR